MKARILLADETPDSVEGVIGRKTREQALAVERSISRQPQKGRNEAWEWGES